MLLMGLLVIAAFPSWLPFASLSYWPVLSIPCALSLCIMTCDWIRYPSAPKLPTLPAQSRFGSFWTLLLASLALVAFQGDFRPLIIRHVLTGGTLGADGGSHVGGALDQPTIGKWYFWFTILSATLLPYLAAVRWASDRSTWRGHLAFALPAFVICLLFLCIITLPFDWLLEYIAAMGWTVRRAMGLAYGVYAYFAVSAFLLWALSEPRAPGFRLLRMQTGQNRDRIYAERGRQHESRRSFRKHLRS
jgi:hypothetical protein